MSNVDISEWKEFEISRLFKVVSPSARIISTYNEGDVPYVSSGGTNNGVIGYLEPKDDETPEKGNCISVSPLEGTPAFYQEFDFLGRGGAGSAISLLYNDNLTKYNALFICEVIKASAKKFDYSDAFTGDNLKTLNIKLPVKNDKNNAPVIDTELNYNDEGNIPDWDYMANYMMTLKQIAQDRIDSLRIIKGNETSIDITEWKEFLIKDIFITEKRGSTLRVPTGASVAMKDLSEGDYPKISVSGINNGVVGYYSSTHKNFRLYKNFLSVSFLGTVFYQPNEAFLDMKVHCLKPKGIELNKYTGLFMSIVVKEAIKKYTYGDQVSSTLLPNVIIKLPVDKKGLPNYSMMEEMMKQIEDKSNSKLSIFKTYQNNEDASDRI